MSGKTARLGRRTQYVDVCQSVLEEVAVATDRLPEEIDRTLYDVVDPDALERLFEDRTAGSDGSHGRIVFPFAGCEVTVLSSGDVSATVLQCQTP